MNLPLLSENTFLLRSLDLILKGLEIKPKASHMLSKSATTSESSCPNLLDWTTVRKFSKTHPDYAKSGEEKQICVSDTIQKLCLCFFRESVYKLSSSKAGVYLKKCVFFGGAIYFKYSCVPPFPARRGL